MPTPCRVAALVVIPLLAACSGGTAHLTKDSYLKKAEELCQRLETQGHALPNPASPRDLPAYLRASTALTVNAQRRLVDLTRSYDDKAYVDKIFLGPMAAQVTAVQSLMPRVVAQSAKGETTALDTLKLPQADLQAMGVYGFHECRKVVGSQ